MTYQFTPAEERLARIAEKVMGFLWRRYEPGNGRPPFRYLAPPRTPIESCDLILGDEVTNANWRISIPDWSRDNAAVAIAKKLHMALLPTEGGWIAIAGGFVDPVYSKYDFEGVRYNGLDLMSTLFYGRRQPAATLAEAILQEADRDITEAADLPF